MKFNKLIKNLLVSTLISVATVNAFAQGKEAFCSSVAQTAEAMQVLNQKQAPLQRVMDIINSSDAGENLKKLNRALAMKAYSVPRFGSEEYKQKAIDDFRDKEHLLCLKAVGNEI
jgi:soluble P-type ATPase